MAPLAPLFRTAFGRRFFTPEWLERKYACEYQGVPGFSCTAFTARGEVAASLGVLPWQIRFGDHIEVAGQLVDAATADRHRRRGLFGRLAETVRELCRAAGISFLFAFPHANGSSFPAFVGKLGYRHIDDLVEYQLPIRTVWAERIPERAGAARSLYERHARRTLSGRGAADLGLENSLIADGFAAVGRDHAFHEYKTSFGGSEVLALDGGRVWVKVSHGLLIGDLEASSEADLDRTERALKRLAVRLGVHQIVFQVSTDTRLSRFFGDRFRTRLGLNVVYLDLGSQIPAEKLRFTFGDLDNF
jgi:hypothetical protein